MTGRINPITFDRMCAERGKSATEIAQLAGLSSSTLAKVRRGDPVDVKVVERLASVFESIATRPRIAELLTA